MLVAPKGEIIWAVYICNGMQTHAITSSALRDVYFLCEVQGNKLVKTKKKSMLSQQPTAFYQEKNTVLRKSA